MTASFEYLGKLNKFHWIRNRSIVVGMDGIKEILDALNTRIRSPIFGSIAISFLLWNWRPLFYLAFSDSTVRNKFIFFDANTTVGSLAWPIFIGTAFALASPWIAWFGSWVAESPTRKRKLLQVNSMHESLLLKQTLEQTRLKMLAEEETTLIQTAKRDTEIKNIQDLEIRKRLETQVEKLRGDLDVAIGKTSSQNSSNEKIIDKRQKLEDRISILNRQIKQYDRDNAKYAAIEAQINNAYDKLAELTKLEE